jgi:hypothetical protein
VPFSLCSQARATREAGPRGPMDKKWVCRRASAPWTNDRPRSRHVTSIERPKIQTPVRAPWGCSNHTVGCNLPISLVPVVHTSPLITISISINIKI